MAPKQSRAKQAGPTPIGRVTRSQTKAATQGQAGVSKPASKASSKKKSNTSAASKKTASKASTSSKAKTATKVNTGPKTGAAKNKSGSSFSGKKANQGTSAGKASKGHSQKDATPKTQAPQISHESPVEDANSATPAAGQTGPGTSAEEVQAIAPAGQVVQGSSVNNAISLDSDDEVSILSRTPSLPSDFMHTQPPQVIYLPFMNPATHVNTAPINFDPITAKERNILDNGFNPPLGLLNDNMGVTDESKRTFGNDFHLAQGLTPAQLNTAMLNFGSSQWQNESVSQDECRKRHLDETGSNEDRVMRLLAYEIVGVNKNTPGVMRWLYGWLAAHQNEFSSPRTRAPETTGPYRQC